jgi:hypothetical protein
MCDRLLLIDQKRAAWNIQLNIVGRFLCVTIMEIRRQQKMFTRKKANSISTVIICTCNYFFPEHRYNENIKQTKANGYCEIQVYRTNGTKNDCRNLWGEILLCTIYISRGYSHKDVSYLLEPCRADFHCLGRGMDPYPRRKLRLQVYSLLQSLWVAMSQLSTSS